MYWQGSRGISNVIAAAVIISATLVAGTIVYVTFLRKADIRVGRAEIRVKEFDVIHGEGNTIVSTTLKNTGGIVLENIRVEVVCSEENRAVLAIDNLRPGSTGGDFKAGRWGLEVGKSYPVVITAQNSENETVLSIGRKVRVQ